MHILITGGAGFFGEILKNEVLRRNHTCVSIDLQRDTCSHPGCTAIQGDIRNIDTLNAIFASNRFDAVFHCAAILAHAVNDKNFLWTSNVDGTRNVRDMAIAHRVPKIVFTSSNCLWGKPLGRPVREDDQPCPVEIYGKSKWEGEKILLERSGEVQSVIFRCPTIIDSGRLGLLAILFAFIDEGRKVWVVGGGRNIYQFIYAQDLANAFLLALDHPQSDIFHIGSDHVQSFRDVYDAVIHKAGTGARVTTIPRCIAIPAMKIAYALKLSPLGPYQYKMIAEDFVFDTTKIKASLQWKPTLSNADMLFKAYAYYREHRSGLQEDADVSAHKQPAKMGIIRVLKWLS